MPLHEPSYFAYHTPYGPITIRASKNGITNVAFGDVPMEGNRKPNRLSNQAATELLEYFAGRRHAFELPLSPDGTPFQHAVWSEIAHIPYGETRTNAQIASAIGKSGSFRAVGVAVRANPLNILVPSHRVVGANGRIPGADKPAQLRRALLELERRHESKTSLGVGSPKGGVNSAR